MHSAKIVTNLLWPMPVMAAEITPICVKPKNFVLTLEDKYLTFKLMERLAFASDVETPKTVTSGFQLLQAP